MVSLCPTALNEHLLDHGGGKLGGSHRAPLRGFGLLQQLHRLPGVIRICEMQI